MVKLSDHSLSPHADRQASACQQLRSVSKLITMLSGTGHTPTVKPSQRFKLKNVDNQDKQLLVCVQFQLKTVLLRFVEVTLLVFPPRYMLIPY